MARFLHWVMVEVLLPNIPLETFLLRRISEADDRRPSRVRRSEHRHPLPTPLPTDQLPSSKS
jgi:hypothetical protein